MENEDLDALIDRNRDRLRELLREIVAEEGEVDPFTIPLDEFLSRSDGERAALVRRAARLARVRVERELEARGAAWLVLVGGDVVATSADREGVPTQDEVLSLGQPRNLVPYLFEAPLIEELPAQAAWTLVATGIRGDRYPTVPIRLGDTVLVADLDTGSHGTLADAALQAAPAPRLWFGGRHLGRDFEWSPEMTQIAVALPDGSTHSASVPVRWVRDWRSSPFVRINSSRRALVGRDTLRALDLHIELRSGAARTDVLGATGRRE